jgi:hypothetical protein
MKGYSVLGWAELGLVDMVAMMGWSWAALVRLGLVRWTGKPLSLSFLFLFYFLF